MCGPCFRGRAYVGEIAARYGAAFVLTTMSLSITMFAIIYTCLRLGGFDARSYLLPYKAHLSDRLFAVLETGGPFAVAFALNKLLSPFRLMISVVIVPKTAPFINALLFRIRPWFVSFCGPVLRVCPCLACCCRSPVLDHPHAQETESLLDPDDDLEAEMSTVKSKPSSSSPSSSSSRGSSPSSSTSSSSQRSHSNPGLNPHSNSSNSINSVLHDVRISAQSLPSWKPATSNH
jgi:hypothetical protein